jgi:hypothetical protein
VIIKNNTKMGRQAQSSERIRANVECMTSRAAGMDDSNRRKLGTCGEYVKYMVLETEKVHIAWRDKGD